MDSWGQRSLSAALGGLITFGIMYVTVVGRYVDRDEVSQMILTESPYVRDAKWIESELLDLSETLEDVNTKLDTLLTR